MFIKRKPYPLTVVSFNEKIAVIYHSSNLFIYAVYSGYYGVVYVSKIRYLNISKFEVD
jgi:hypothetical protein